VKLQPGTLAVITQLPCLLWWLGDCDPNNAVHGEPCLIIGAGYSPKYVICIARGRLCEVAYAWLKSL